MDDHIRISDADRDRVTARLRDHFADGRLTRDELDERVAAALNAKTSGDLRRVMADLPEPAAALPRPVQFPPRAAPPWTFRHRPRVLPLLLLALVAALLIPGGGWVLLTIVKVFLVFWLVASLVAIVLIGRFRRRMRRQGWPGYPPDRRPGWPGGHHHRGRRYSRWQV
ncbi:MAG TPA: DUF1707 domain-containing protein [Streptosporangiaceae bacterium]|nr:DUF1707 domain-containing protein [Streptosporangiaceae bacterium]